MTKPVIQVENLSIRLSGKAILQDITLNVSAGEYVSIIGPNGAGKTTLIKCMGGIYRDCGGSIQIGGKAIKAYSSKELAQLLSYVPQAEGRTLPFSVEEFVMMGRYPHLSPFTPLKAEDREAVDRAIAQTGIEALRNQPMNTLSGGERQMAFIAGALAQGARIFLLDEPTTFLDYRHQAAVMRILKSICSDSGITIIAVHHDINIATENSDRMIALKDGRIAFDGISAEITDSATLEEIFDTPFHCIADNQRPLPLVIPGGAE
ncbi:MAG: ABC transporter ATP-binding protein [Kiritimatiellales bacterium]|nr:ABC transporter ATP-binding protein [Kiritimatiellales bacterium]